MLFRSKIAKGWATIRGKVYYFDARSGVMATSRTVINGQTFHFKGDGAINGERGQAFTGWHTTGGGTKSHYFLVNGAYGTKGRMVKGLSTLSGRTYFFDNTGTSLTGWRTISGRTYYFKPTGHPRGDRGQALKGWHRINGRDCYFDSRGVYDANRRK